MINSEYREDVDTRNEHIEPVFYPGLNKDRKLPANTSASHTINSFEYRLKNSPNDLTCHLQRIQFFIFNKNNAQLFSSLCDLLIILGAQGLPLRQSLFVSCKRALKQEQAEFFESHLTKKHIGTH